MNCMRLKNSGQDLVRKNTPVLVQRYSFSLTLIWVLRTLPPTPITFIHSFNKYCLLGTVLGTKDIVVTKIQMILALMVLISYHCTIFCQLHSFIYSFIKHLLHTYYVPETVFRALRCTSEQNNDPCSSGTCI